MSINFFKGHPSNSLHPNGKIVEATSQLLLGKRDYDEDPENRHPLTYGSDSGSKWVRTEVSNFLNRSFDLKDKQLSQYQNFNLTGGASYGIMNILTQTTLPHTGYTKQAFIITPTYFLINEVFIDAGFGGKITAIDEYENGTIDLKSLEEKLKKLDESNEDHQNDLELINGPNDPKKIYKFVLYCIPNFSNPGGQTYNLETRLKLIQLARKYDVLLISDDVYDLLDYTQPLDKLPTPKLKRLTHLDRETYTNEYGNTISNSTFSKLIAPGLRFGFQESVNDKLVYQLSQGGANVSGGTPSQLNSMIVGTILKNGAVEGIINNFRKIYSERAKVLKAKIEEHLPKGTRAFGLEGGYFVWVTLPEGYDSNKIVDQLKKKGVILASGDNFEVFGDARGWGKRNVRLSISWLTKEEISEGVTKWGQVIRELYGSS